MMDCFQWQSWLMAFHSSYCTSVLQHGSRVSCHWEKGMWSNTFPFSVCDLQNIANRLLATNKKSLNNKVRARPATQYKQVASSMGNVGGWIQDYLEGKKKRKADDLQTLLFRSQYYKQRCGEGNAQCYISSTGYPTTLTPSGFEGKESLFSLPNGFSRTQPRLSDLTPGRFLPWGIAQLQVEKKEKKQTTTKRKNQRPWSLSGTMQLGSWKAQPSLSNKY